MALQAGQTAQAHLENRGGLGLGQREALHQLRGRLFIGLRPANDGDDLVDMVKRDKQALQDMGALFGLAQIEARTADDDVFLVLDVVEQHLLERKRVGHAVDQREHVHAPADLQLGVLVQLVEHNLGNGVLLQLDDDVDRAVAVGAVVHVRDLGEFLLANELAQLGHQVGTVHLIGDLGDDDGALAVLALDDLVLGANRQAAAAGLVCVDDALAAHDDAAGGEVGARKHLHELLGGDVRVVEHHARGVDRLAQVMRRDVRRHADGDAVAAVDEQVREARGKHLGLLQALVVVRAPVDRFLLEVAQKLHCGLRQTSLGVTHGGG